VPTRGVRARAIGLGWLIGAFVLLGLGAFVTSFLGSLPVFVALLALVVSLAVDVALWLWTSWVLPNRRVPVRALLLPALAGAVGLEVLKVLGGYVVPRLVESSSALYGAIGVVFALIAWLWLFGRLVVVVTVLEVMGWEHTHGTVEMLVDAPVIPSGRTRR
jgi:membrane protein